MAPERIPAVPAAVIHHPALGRVSVSQQSNRVPCLYLAGLASPEFLRGHLMKLRLLTILLLCMPLAACGKTVHWKQEVLLQDGRVIVVERRSKQARAYISKSIIEYEQSISFTNPDTKEEIEWSIPKGTRPKMLNFSEGVPYVVFRAGSVADYRDWGCPNPPHIVFVYRNGQWIQRPFTELPKHFNIPNLLDAAGAYKALADDGVVTVAEMALYLQAGKRLRVNVIDGTKISPISAGCTKEILLKQGRQAEIVTDR
jgi:hypothetical protein